MAVKKRLLWLTSSKSNNWAKEIGGDRAAKELGIPEGTVYTWLKAVRSGKLDIGDGSHTPTGAMSLAEEITMLRKRIKEQRMMFIALKTEDGRIKGKIAFCCRVLEVSRQGFYKYLANKDRLWKYQGLADAMTVMIHNR